MSDISGGSLSKSGSLDVTPVRAVLSLTSDSISGGISDIVEVAHTMVSEGLVQKVNEMDFIDGEVVLRFQVARISGGSRGAKGLIVGSVGGETSDNFIASSVVQNFLEDGNDLLEVVVPTEPSTMSGIEIRYDVAETMELLQGVSNTFFVGGLTLLTFLVVHVGGKIGKGIRLNNGYDRHVRILLELSDNLINILGLVGIQSIRALVVSTGELTIRCTGRAISVG
jgi:hypothetical protein